MTIENNIATQPQFGSKLDIPGKAFDKMYGVVERPSAVKPGGNPSIPEGDVWKS